MIFGSVDLVELGFTSVVTKLVIGRPKYHPAEPQKMWFILSQQYIANLGAFTVRADICQG